MRQEVGKGFQGFSWWILNSFRWNCNQSTLIPVWTCIALTLGENWQSSSGCWFSLEGPWQRGDWEYLKAVPGKKPNGSISNCDRSTSAPIWTATTVPWGEASLGFQFSVSKPWGKECFKCFKEVPNESQTVPDRTVTDLLHFPSGLPVLFSWGRIDCQAVEFSSKWMKPEAGGIPGVSSHFLHKSKQFQMDLWQIYIDSHLDS